MKSILVVGLGRFGRHVARKLHEQHNQVLAVDKDEKSVNAVLPYVEDAQIGDTTDEDFLDSLGVSDFDICYVCIGDNFQSSLETTAFLKEKGAPFVVARASRDVHAKFLLRNGADEVVYPEKQMAEWAAIRFTSSELMDYFALDEGNGVFEIKTPERWIGQSVAEVNLRKKFNINLLGVKKNGELSLNITPDTVFERGETLIVLGEYKKVHKCLKPSVIW